MQQLHSGLRAILAVGALVGATANVAALKGSEIVHHSGLSGHLINLLQSIDNEGSEEQTGINVTVKADLLRDALKDLEGGEAGDVDVLDKAAINSLVNSLGAIKANSSKSTPGMQAFVKKVTDMIDNDLVGKVKLAHSQSQKVGGVIYNNFLACKNSKSTADGQVRKLLGVARQTDQRHYRCRLSEQKKWRSKTAALKLLAQKKKLMDGEKKKLDILRRDPNTEANVCHPSKTPWKHPSAYYGTWLASNLRYFAKREKLWFKQKLIWQNAKVDHDRYRPKALRIEKNWKQQVSLCNTFQKTLEGSTCGGAKLMFSSCEQRYWGCYMESQEVYRQTKPFLLKQEKDRKAEWRALMRIKCILNIFMDGDADEDKIDECKQKTHKTDHLTLKIKNMPRAERCSPLPNTPCSTAFVKQYYSRLPRNTKKGALEQCSQCVVFSEGFPTRPLYWLQARNYHPDTNTWNNRGAGPSLRGVSRSSTKPWLEFDDVGHGSKRKILALKGTSRTSLYFGNVIPSRYTVCVLARYTGGRRGRILHSSSTNWLLGHWAGRAGVAHLGQWKTSTSTRLVKDRDDWLVMCGRNGLKSPGNIMVNGKATGTRSGGSRPGWLGINHAPYRGEQSDFAISELIIFQEQLPDQEMTKVQNYLLGKLAEKKKPGPDKNYRTEATTCTAPQLSKLNPGWRDRRTFRCMDGTCIKRKGMCNGFNNCKDGSDEKICSKLLTKPNPKYRKPARTCTIKQKLKLRPGMGDLRAFRCWDGSCTHITGKCNGVANCMDGSDEKLCSKVKRKQKAKAQASTIKMLTKYERRWPHCRNLVCFSKVTLDAAKKRCAKWKACDGFSFTRDPLKKGKGKGGGCYKQKCKVERRFGHNSHGYVAKYIKAPHAKCNNLKVSYPVWGYSKTAGIDISAYVEGIRWMGCVGNGCRAKDFYCTDTPNSLEFGVTNKGVLRSLFGDEIPNKFRNCASTHKSGDIGNAPLKDDAVVDLCDKLGYKGGEILEHTEANNWCPYVVSVKGEKDKGTTDKFSLFWESKGTRPKPATKIKCFGHKSLKKSLPDELGLKMEATWTDTENKCSSQIPENVWGKCKTEARDKIAIEVTYQNGYHGFAYYEGVKDKWGKSFPNLMPKMQKGFFKVDPSGPLYKLDYKSSITGTYYPMAWRGLSNAWSRNYDLTSTARNCNDAKAERKGWGSMRVDLFC